jgi:hypothetical protein
MKEDVAVVFVRHKISVVVSPTLHCPNVWGRVRRMNVSKSIQDLDKSEEFLSVK